MSQYKNQTGQGRINNPAPRPSAQVRPAPRPAPRPSAQVRPAPRPSAQVRPAPRPSASSARERTMSVAERREAAKAAGMSMSQFKNQIGEGRINKNKTGQGNVNSPSPSPQPGRFDSYNERVGNLADEYVAKNPNGGIAAAYHAGKTHNQMFDEDGYLSYDSEKAMFQANEHLKELGFKAGDMLWKPGTKDNLNGRELTGRIAYITKNGNYIPEYVNDAVNSSHLGSGFSNWQGEVGLGDAQAAHNATLTDAQQGATDPRTGGVYQPPGGQFADGSSFDNPGYTYDQAASNYYQDQQYDQQNQETQNYNTTNQYTTNTTHNSYDYSAFAPGARGGGGSKFQAYQGLQGPSSFGGRMNFNFNPIKFLQGQ